ncbi:MAG: M20/M25/M40 family metallo-hydrolase [Dokdonella sp.]
MRAAIVLFVVLVLSAWLTAVSLRTPEPLPAHAPNDQFSAMRARVDLDWLAAQAHPTGSPALQQARVRLIDRFAGLGLQVSTQPAFAVNEFFGTAAAARLENVIGILPGVDRSAPALLLMAHIDSVSNSPGAADDGIGVVAMIEIARVLAAEATPQRDVIFLFTDGEEIGLLGAAAFFDQNPLAKHVGMVLNLEARGSSGPVSMFQTGTNNAALIDLYGRVAKNPEASSLTSFAYKHMPNDTDFTIALKHGLPGLNFAIVGDQFDYHSASATPANLDLGSLQQMGDQALAISRELATSTSLPTASSDSVYADLLGVWLVHYPAWVGWLLLAASAGLLLLAARRLRWRFGDLLREFGLCIYVLITTALALRIGYRLLGGVANPGLSEGRNILAGFEQFDWGSGLTAVAVVVFGCAAMLRGRLRVVMATTPLLIGIACSVRGGFDVPALIAGVVAALVAVAVFGRRRGTPGVGIGIAVLVLLLGIVAQMMAPELTPILLWPLLAGSVVLALLGTRGSTLTVAAIAVVGIAFLAKFADGVMVGLGFGMPEVAALPTMLGVLLVYPLLVATMHPLALGERRGKRALGSLAPTVFAGLIAIAGMALWLLVAQRPAGDARKPAISQVMHVSDADSQQDHRVSALDQLDDWSREALTATGTEIERGSLPAAFINKTWQASTPAVSALPLSLVVGSDEGGRHVLTITPPAGARELRLQLRATVAASDVQLEGHAVALLDDAGQWNRLRLFPNGEPIRLSWHADGAGALEVAHAAISDGWPADATPLPERPRDVMPWGLSDTHIVTGTSKLQW